MITSRHNQRLKEVRRARAGKGPLAVLEGPHLVLEALAAGLELDEVLATPDFLAGEVGAHLVERLTRRPRRVEPALLASLADADSPRGVLATMRLERGGAERLPVASDATYLYLAGVQDPGNLGALARVAEGAGATGLAIARGGASTLHPRALRASAGSLLRLPVAVDVDPEAVDRRLGGAGPVAWIALEAHGDRSLWRAELPTPRILALGAEGPGLPADVADRCTHRVTIPMAGRLESLNVAVAAGVVLFELRRRQGAGGSTSSASS